MAFLKSSVSVKCKCGKKSFLTLYTYTCTLIIMLLFPAVSQAGDDIKLYEQEIKVGLLYNFLKYTNWPADSFGQDNKINVCIFGDDPFGGYLQPMQGRSVSLRTISIRNIHSASEADSCQMLFVNSDEKNNWPELRNYLANKNILTVSDIKDFTSTGGMIEFTRNNDRVNVALNQDVLNTTKLSVQDRLLKLVTVVHGSINAGGQ
jgi:hypothetical protein